MDLFDFKITKEVSADKIGFLVPKWYHKWSDSLNIILDVSITWFIEFNLLWIAPILLFYLILIIIQCFQKW